MQEAGPMIFGRVMNALLHVSHNMPIHACIYTLWQCAFSNEMSKVSKKTSMHVHNMHMGASRDNTIPSSEMCCPLGLKFVPYAMVEMVEEPSMLVRKKKNKKKNKAKTKHIHVHFCIHINDVFSRCYYYAF